MTRKEKEGMNLCVIIKVHWIILVHSKIIRNLLIWSKLVIVILLVNYSSFSLNKFAIAFKITICRLSLNWIYNVIFIYLTNVHTLDIISIMKYEIFSQIRWWKKLSPKYYQFGIVVAWDNDKSITFVVKTDRVISLHT